MSQKNCLKKQKFKVDKKVSHLGQKRASDRKRKKREEKRYNLASEAVIQGTTITDLMIKNLKNSSKAKPISEKVIDPFSDGSFKAPPQPQSGSFYNPWDY